MLVPLNGRHLVPQGSGSTVNLQAIPMSAIEHVEILTDGASALYGSDALAGVVNFILKRNPAGREYRGELQHADRKPRRRFEYASDSYGFGDLETRAAASCPFSVMTGKARLNRLAVSSRRPATSRSTSAAIAISTTAPAPQPFL
jgi:hypothetical protein